jgi:hypothetical protein
MRSPVRGRGAMTEIESGPGSKVISAQPYEGEHMVGAPSTPTLASHTSGRTVYFDPSLSTSSFGLALRAFSDSPNGLG